MTFLTRDGANICTPFRPDLATLIPHARTLNYQGQPWLVIPNGRDETKLARNLGVHLPAPILTRYDWCGQKPWDIQRTTAAMLSENARAYCLSTMGCVDADTEYLAPDGWHRIADYRSGMVAEYRPETGMIAFVDPGEFVKLPCAEMIRFKTTRGVDQLLSPEHRVLYADWSGATHVDSAEAIYGRYDLLGDRALRFITTFRVEGTAGLALTDAEIRLQVAVNADGHQLPYENGKVSVRVKKPRKVARIVRLLDAAGVAYTTGPSGDHTAFRFVSPEPKHAFAGWWDATQAQLEVIADEAAHWDGSHRKAKGLSFSSLEKSSCDFIQYAYSASGRRASLGVSTRERRGGVEQEWRVHAGNGTPLAGLVGVNADGTRRRNAWREPSTDGFKYCFMVPSTFLLLRRNGCIFATGNTGKTRSVIYAFDWLRKSGRASKMLVSAPLSTLTPVWEDELFRNFPHLRRVVLYGDRAKRLRLLATDADVYICNHHGIDLLGPALLAKKFDVVCIDELAILRNKSTKLWKAHASVVGPAPFAWGLTGSPTPMAPTDAWAQIKLLTPHRVARTMLSFQDQVMRRVSQFRWVAREDANDTVHAAMQPAVRFTREDIAELPATSYANREVKLDPVAQRAYDLLFKKMAMLTAKGERITAANEGVLQSKLLQVSCGYIYTDQGTNGSKQIYELPNGPRLAALDETIAGTNRKVIVFVPFIHSLEGIAAHLRGKGHDVAVVHGGVSRGQRDIIFRGFQHGASPRIIIAHPQCMAHGLTLTAADTIIWASPTSSLEIYEQANARIVRPSQTAKTLICHLVGTPVERLTYARLKARGSMQGLLLAMFRQQELDF